MRRRRLLGAAGLGLATGLSGCLASGFAGSDTRALPPPTPPASCEPATALRPMPDDDRARAYPTLPASVDPASAESFARSHEATLQHNARVAAYHSIQVRLSVPTGSVVPAGDGQLVGIDGRVQFGEPATPEGTATVRPSGTFVYSVWYYVTGTFALRGAEANDPIDERAVPEGLDGRVVACAGG